MSAALDIVPETHRETVRLGLLLRERRRCLPMPVRGDDSQLPKLLRQTASMR